jgi:hypothetical protein
MLWLDRNAPTGPVKPVRVKMTGVVYFVTVTGTETRSLALMISLSGSVIAV